MGDGAATDARETLKQLTSAIESHLGSDLLGRFINEARAKYRADVHDPHHALISFTDHAAAEADGLIR